MLKLKYILLICAFPIFGFAQSHSEPEKWHKNEWVTKKIKSVSCYTYTVSKKGKVKKDSILEYRKTVDYTSKKISGLMRDYSDLAWRKKDLKYLASEELFDKNGNMVRQTYSPLTKTCETRGDLKECIFEKNETVYQYDSLDRISKETRFKLVSTQTVFKGSTDTIHQKSWQIPTITEFGYEANGKISSQYYTRDSTRYEHQDPKKVTASCLYCEPRHLEQSWKYNEKSELTQWISYTKDGAKHSKNDFEYDSQGRPTRQIDSTGWHIGIGKKNWLRTKTYEYTPQGKIVTTQSNPEETYSLTSKTISYLNSNGETTKKISYLGEGKNEETVFVYSGNLKMSETATTSDGQKTVVEYRYSAKGDLIEERVIKNQKLSRLTRYFYERLP